MPVILRALRTQPRRSRDSCTTHRPRSSICVPPVHRFRVALTLYFSQVIAEAPARVGL